MEPWRLKSSDVPNSTTKILQRSGKMTSRVKIKFAMYAKRTVFGEFVLANFCLLLSFCTPHWTYHACMLHNSTCCPEKNVCSQIVEHWNTLLAPEAVGNSAPSGGLLATKVQLNSDGHTHGTVVHCSRSPLSFPFFSAILQVAQALSPQSSLVRLLCCLGVLLPPLLSLSMELGGRLRVVKCPDGFATSACNSRVVHCLNLVFKFFYGKMSLNFDGQESERECGLLNDCGPIIFRC